MALCLGRTRLRSRPRGYNDARGDRDTPGSGGRAYTLRASNCPGQSFSPTVKASVRVKPLAS